MTGRNGERVGGRLATRRVGRDGVHDGVPAGPSRAAALRFAEAAPAASEAERLLTAVRQLTGIAVWEWDLGSGALRWSPQMYALMGLDPGDDPDISQWLSWLHPEDRDRLAEQDREALAARRGWSIVFRVLPPDGRLRHLKAWCEPVLDETGVPVGVIGATLDVTEAEQAARDLEESRQQLDAAAHLTGLGTWAMRLEDKALTWSDGMYACYAKDPATWTATFDELVPLLHPEDLPVLGAAQEEVVRTGVPRVVTHRAILDDGRLRYMRTWVALRRDASGRPDTMWGTVLDVTDEQEQLARLARSREEFRLAFEQAPNGMAALEVWPDGSARLVRVNRALRDLLGVDESALVGGRNGWSLRGFREPTDGDRERLRSFLRTLAGPQAGSLSIELRLERLDGTPFVAWIHAAAADDAVLGDGLQHDATAADRPRTVLFHVVDLTQRRQNEADLERLALTDAVTGLGNRTRLERALTASLAGTGTGRAVGLLLLDLDRFKVVNDSLGHVAGDCLLVEVAARLRELAADGVLVCRLGGDEFALLVEDAPDPYGLLARADAVRERLSDPYTLADGAVLVSTVSVGVVRCDDPSSSVEDLYRQADLALYAAKDAGRDTCALFDDDLRARADERIRAERSLRDALAADGVRAHLQPVVDLATGRVVAVEALARLEHRGGLLMPADFIAVAEDTGLVVEIDARVAELAVAHLARADVEAQLRAAVNVSPRTLEHPEYARRLAQALRRYGVAPDRILVELTESGLLDATGARTAGLQRLRDLGVQLGIDDFGTGYSMLAYLDRFPVDFLKVDRSFVARLGSGTRPDTVVRAIVSLAHAHDLVVTAEGVETAEQAEILRSMGCERAQGWLFGRPAAPEPEACEPAPLLSGPREGSSPGRPHGGPAAP